MNRHVQLQNRIAKATAKQIAISMAIKIIAIPVLDNGISFEGAWVELLTMFLEEGVIVGKDDDK